RTGRRRPRAGCNPKTPLPPGRIVVPSGHRRPTMREHGKHMWICAAMIAAALIVVAVTGSAYALLPVVGCVLMMGAMMRLMAGMGGHRGEVGAPGRGSSTRQVLRATIPCSAQSRGRSRREAARQRLRPAGGWWGGLRRLEHVQFGRLTEHEPAR